MTWQSGYPANVAVGAQTRSHLPCHVTVHNPYPLHDMSPWNYMTHHSLIKRVFDSSF